MRNIDKDLAGILFILFGFLFVVYFLIGWNSAFESQVIEYLKQGVLQ